MSDAELEADEAHCARQSDLSAMQARVTELETERKALRLAVIGLLGIAREAHDAVCDQQPVSESGEGCCRIWHRIQEADEALNGKAVLGRCASCYLWQPAPTFVPGCEPEKVCGGSRNMTFGMYGQDGRSVITTRDFGCVHFRPVEGRNPK